MPLWELRGYMAALPAVLAERALRDAQVVAVGSGALTKEARGELLSRWERDAAGPRPVVRPMTREGHAALVAGAGIGLVLVPKTTEPEA